MSDRLHSEAEDRGGNTLVWFLAGAFVGAAVAILYAPQSGRDTRNYLSEKGRQGKEAVTETSASIADASREMFERGRKLVQDASDLFERGRKLVKG
jgi:gas vesicle protein